MEFWYNLMPVHTGILNLLKMYVLIKWKLHGNVTLALRKCPWEQERCVHLRQA